MKIQNKHIGIAISGRIGEKCLGNKRRKEKNEGRREGGIVRRQWYRALFKEFCVLNPGGPR